MRAFDKPEIEILVFQVNDVITTSSTEHDNAGGDFGDLVNL